MKTRLGDLRLGEVFYTALTGREGIVMDWGHTRHSHHQPGPRPRIPAVVVEFEGRRLLMSPDAYVLADPSRPHWTQSCRPVPAERWGRYVGDEEGE